jgi:excisionase family DNA binding protein
MRNSIRPRNISALPTAAGNPSNTTSFSGNPQADAPEMFNILIALESARGLLSVRDVARLLGRSKFTIYRMAEQRKIPSLMIGGSRCFDPSVLALWLSKKEPTLATAARRLKTA